ncbi:MAG: YegP family protein [Longimicrobiales bacterium]
MAEFEIYQDASDEYRWRFRANNGEIVADSAEGYANRRDCERGIEIVKSDAPSAAIQNLLDAG